MADHQSLDDTVIAIPETQVHFIKLKSESFVSHLSLYLPEEKTIDKPEATRAWIVLVPLGSWDKAHLSHSCNLRVSVQYKGKQSGAGIAR
jgi:hypothetical protein